MRRGVQPYSPEPIELKQQLEQLLLTAVSGLAGGILPEAPEASAIAVERTRDAKHGDAQKSRPPIGHRPRPRYARRNGRVSVLDGR